MHFPVFDSFVNFISKITIKGQFMETITGFINTLNAIAWGPVMLILILGTGLFLMIGLKFMPLSHLNSWFSLSMARS